MNYSYFQASGNIINPEELTIPKANNIFQYLKLKVSPYSSFIECRKDGENEVIVLEVDVEVGQKNKHDIKKKEKVAITFFKEDKRIPEVVALRDNFPRVPHINLREEEFPRSICLFDTLYEDLKQRWTASFLIERIREWLALTAKGKLHAEEQPLEPLLMGYGIPLIIPHNLFSEQEETSTATNIYSLENPDNSIVFIANVTDKKSHQSTNLAITIKCPPQKHGVISKSPKTIKELHDFINQTGANLRDKLRSFFKNWMSDENKLNSKLILIIYFPKTRHDNNIIESTDIWAFITGKTIREIGVDLGLWSLEYNQKPGLLIPSDEQKIGEETNLIVLNPTFTLSRDKAAYLNQRNNPENPQIVAIGAGTLGSGVLLNSIRAGYGEWTLIDEDSLAPHNLARHELHFPSMGHSKAFAVCEYAQNILDEENVCRAIMADVINPKDNKEDLDRAYLEADVILDMSASSSVSKHIVFEIQSDARRICIFINPSGTDLVILAEDKERKIQIDHLEYQYYQKLAEKTEFSEHLTINNQQLRYARSCSDITNRIPYNYVSIHSAIASEILPDILKKEEAFIGLWHINSHNFSVDSHRIIPVEPISPVASKLYKINNWTIYTYSHLINKIFSYRQNKLPNETGGVLIGSYDMTRKSVYVVDTILSPIDSVEKPKIYIRGTKGLTNKLKSIEYKTANQLEYVGEWHSHPKDYNPNPSNDDKKLFQYLKENMQINSLPTLMAIAGSNKKMCWLLDGEQC